MLIQHLIRRSAVTIPMGATVAEASRLMKENEVGSVVVLNGERVVGILTDRDVAISVVAEGLHGSTALVDEVMARDPVCALADSDVNDCLRLMQEHSVRRIPLLSEHGRLLGVVSLDDVLLYIGSQFGAAASLIRQELLGRVRITDGEDAPRQAGQAARIAPDPEC
jgi:CBS domain-containing protein